MPERVYNVLFLCTADSARGVMAERLIEREGKSRFRGFGAGGRPAGRVSPLALDLLKRLGHTTEGLRFKSWAATGNAAERAFAFAEAYRVLATRIGLFLSLPIDRPDRLALERRVEAIGEAAHDAPPAEGVA